MTGAGQPDGWAVESPFMEHARLVAIVSLPTAQNSISLKTHGTVLWIYTRVVTRWLLLSALKGLPGRGRNR